MTPPKDTWAVSPTTGLALARLLELYARALRVDTARKVKQMTKLADLVRQDTP